MNSTNIDVAPNGTENNETAHSVVPESIKSVPMKPRKILLKNALPIAGCFFIAFVLGINDGNFGIILPRIKEYYNVSDGLVSILFICQAIGYFVAAFSNGWIVRKLKQLGALYLGSGLAVLAYVLLLIGLPFPAMCCFMPILGAAFGLMDSGANVFPSYLPYTTTILNFVHAFYGVGTLTGPLMASALYTNNLSWRVSYMILAGIAVLNCIMVFLAFRRVPIEEQEEVVKVKERGTDVDIDEKPIAKRGRFMQVITMRFTWTLAIFLLLHVGMGTTIGSWGYTYLTTARNGDPVQMARVMSGFWAGLTVGRVVLGHIVGMFGVKRMVTAFMVIACSMVVLLWQSTSIRADSAALVVMAMVLGPMFPTAISYSHQVLPKHLHATAVGFLVGFGQGGVAFFPFINGQVIDKAGIKGMMPYELGVGIATAIIWILVPSPVPMFSFLSRLNVTRLGKKNSSLPVDKSSESSGKP